MPQTLNEQLSRTQQIAALEKDWATNPRWKGVKRGYSAADVVRLRGSVQIEHSLAKRGSEKLWRLINGEAKKGYVNSFGAISAGQAMQQAKAGLEAVYSVRLASRCRRQHFRDHVPRPIALRV
jgi:isocitrate lyase